MSEKLLERGTVKYFNFSKKFGFIIPENGKDDIFVHYSDILGEYPNKRLLKGDLVEFATVDDERGKKKAIEVRKVGSAATDESAGFSPAEAAYETQPAFQETLDCHNLLEKLSMTEKSSDTASFITHRFKRFRCQSLSTTHQYVGTIEIIYEPNDRLIDVESLGAYLSSFSQTQCDYDKVIEIIYGDLMTLTKPLTLEVTGHFDLNSAVETSITLGNATPAS